MDTSDDVTESLYMRMAQSLDLFVEDLAMSLKKYHSPKFDAIALLDDYGLQNGQLWERSADFQAGLLAVLAHWETPHVEGIWLVSLNEELPPFCIHPPCPEILSISYKGEDLYSFSHVYLLQLGHIVLALHQILDELATLKENPRGFVFDPEFKALRSLKGLSDLLLLKATWGVLMFCARKAHERISHKLCMHHIALMQIEGASIHSNDLTISVVQEEFLKNSPCTNILQLLQQEDYRTGIPSSIQEPIHKWLQNLPKPLPTAPSRIYHSNLNPVTSVPAVLPSITTHPVQVHFATTNPSMSVYLPGFGTVEDTQGVGLSSIWSCKAASTSSTNRRPEIGGPLKRPQDSAHSLPSSPRSNSPTNLQPLLLASQASSNNRNLAHSSYLQGTDWTIPASHNSSQYSNNQFSSCPSNQRQNDDSWGRLSSCAQGKQSESPRNMPPHPLDDNSNKRGGFGGNGEGPGGNGGGHGGRNDLPSPPGPDGPGGEDDPPDPPLPAGNLPLVAPRQPTNFRWQLSFKIPLSTIPEWNGSPTSVIQYNGDTNEDSSSITCTSDEEESSSMNCLFNGYCSRSVMLSFSTWKKPKLKQLYAVAYLINILAPGEPTFSMNIHAPSANYWNVSHQQSAFLAYEYSEDESSNPLHNVSELLSNSAFEQAEGLAVDYKCRKPAKSSTKQGSKHIDWPNGRTFKGHAFTRNDSQRSPLKPPGDCCLCTSPLHFYRECPHFPMWDSISKRLHAQGQQDAKDLRKVDREYEAHVASLRVDESDESDSDYIAPEVTEYYQLV
ncbi:hypothetical protein BDN71DRAFT_1436355 [Pleurotus eryngii]|uniref:Uncharacterized protein n=1 Tax=Pleurotus eryngii TaxID=5323 RepID=A0A9P6D236_PLEER|nr:hypothetical protein BDN71DRAFT_1436355 [Pleurotus eryngii]